MRDGAVGVGVVGLGFAGRAHLDAYRRAAAAGHPNRIVAVCDPDPERRAGRTAQRGNLERGDGTPAFDVRDVRGCADVDELLADPAIDVVSVCTPTETHVDLAIRALAAGKHVLVEKPIALTVDEARRLADAAREARTFCLPALCMRFWPAWRWLRDRIKDMTYGTVQSAVFRRLATRPDWSPVYADPARTGGALFDLHVHDADFVHWCFGPPAGVRVTGTRDHLTVFYGYPDGPPHVVAEAGWDHSEGFPFRMQFTVVFQYATADFDLGRDPELLLAQVGSQRSIPLPQETGHDGEVRWLLDAVRTGSGTPPASLDEVVKVTALLEEAGKGLTAPVPTPNPRARP